MVPSRSPSLVVAPAANTDNPAPENTLLLLYLPVTTETGTLRSGPRFECLDGAILVVEFTSSAGHSFFDAYFADGTNIGYGRQQIDKRGNRFVLPIQAKARIAAPLRAAFDYHCRLDIPIDPIPPAARADCIF